jgi:predicted amidophosphoribosyltransferase
MNELCPQCQQTLQWQNGSFFCAACQQLYQQQAHCPDCQSELQKLTACGAVDYFCQNGHGMVSKKRVIFSYLPISQ